MSTEKENDGLVSTIFLDAKSQEIVMVPQIDHDDQKRTLPGGKIKKEEDLDVAAVREMCAEAGENLADILLKAIEEGDLEIVTIPRIGERGPFTHYVYFVLCDIPELRDWGIVEAGEELGPPEKAKFYEIIQGWLARDDEKFPIAWTHRKTISTTIWKVLTNEDQKVEDFYDPWLIKLLADFSGKLWTQLKKESRAYQRRHR